MTYHTNIRHQETVALLGSRNLQLRVVYAHIANYTMAKGAWCGKRQKLADELEMERSVVSRKLDELITMGVVVADGDSYRAVNTEERAESTEQRAVQSGFGFAFWSQTGWSSLQSFPGFRSGWSAKNCFGV